MNREQKELLIKDLSARLPYGLKCEILETNEIKTLASIRYDGENTLFDFWEDDQKIRYGYQLYLSEFKPCLIPLSSMTAELMEELNISGFFNYRDTITNVSHLESQNGISKEIYTYIDIESISFLMELFHSHHIDYRDLTTMNLAKDVTNLQIY